MMKNILFTLSSMLLISPCIAAPDDLLEGEFSDLEFQSILSATRLKTSHRDAPASVSVISAEDIKRYRFRNVPEALKTVPGFFVGQSHSSYDQYFVGYHGGNSNVPRRTNLLIDGVTYFQPGLSRIQWEELPIVMDEIQSIEVIRGPAASLYGSNSFTSIVNITTKDPKQTLGKIGSKGIAVNGRVGQPGVRDASISYTSNIEDLYYRLTFSHVHDHGFDVTRTGEERRDSTWINHIDLRGQLALSDTSEIEFNFGHTQQNQLEQFINPSQTSFPDYEQNSTRGSVMYINDLSSKHNLQILANFRTFTHEQRFSADVPAFLTSPELRNLSLINSDYANAIADGLNPIGSGGGAEADMQAALAFAEIMSIGASAFAPISLVVPQDYSEDMYQLEIQDIYAYSDEFRLLTGASVTFSDTASRQWVIDGDRALTTYRAFINAEWTSDYDIVINTGTMAEYDNEIGTTLSPRLAVAYHLTDKHSLRYVYSRATRTPDIFEQFADWRLIGEDFSFNPFPNTGNVDFLTFYARGVSPGGLEPEKITSNEIGYFYSDPSTRTEIDVRLFREDLTSLISEKLELRNFNPTNSGFAKKQGLDLAVKSRLTPSLHMMLAYSYVDIDSVINEKTITSRHVGSLSLSYDINTDYSLSVSYYGFSRPLAVAPSSNPQTTTAGEPIESLDVTLQWSGETGLFDDIDVFVQTRIRNGNAEIQVDNLYQDRTKTVAGFSVQF